VDRGVALLFRDLGARRGLVVSTTPRSLYPGERPGTHCTGGWVGSRAGLDMCEKSHPHRDFFYLIQGTSTYTQKDIRSPDRPARSQSLYRLSYPAHSSDVYCYEICCALCPAVQKPECAPIQWVLATELRREGARPLNVIIRLI
jgi:hypothetical protein